MEMGHSLLMQDCGRVLWKLRFICRLVVFLLFRELIEFRVVKDSLLSRLAIIHMVHEARGLDVNPQTIERFKRMKDGESVDVLEVIHCDEVRLVPSPS